MSSACVVKRGSGDRSPKMSGDLSTIVTQEPDEPPSDQPPSPALAPDRHCAAIILAGGQGTRMKSRLKKELHQVAGRPMIDAVLHAAGGCAPRQVVVVVGHNADQLRQHLSRAEARISFALQEDRWGTGGAVMAGLPAVDPVTDDVVVLFGDQPLITPEMVAALLAGHRRSGAVVATEWSDCWTQAEIRFAPGAVEAG